MSSSVEIDLALLRAPPPPPPAAANDLVAAAALRSMRGRKPETVLGQRVRKQFARNVRQLRTHKGMTQADLACAAGLGRSFVSQLERGRFSATLETIAALATALAVPPSLLLT